MIKAEALNQEQIREINRINIIHILRDKGETTKQAIAKILGISIPTVTTNINLLIEEGLVEMAGVAKSTGGRKPQILRFKKNARYAFGVDVRPQKVSVILLNLNYEEVCSSTFTYKFGEGFDTILNQIELETNRLLETVHINKKNVLGLGMSLPGMVNEEKLVLEYAPNIGVKGYCFETFQKKIGMKVSIENEANVAAFAESVIGLGKDKHNLVYVSITEGVGTGIIINDHIFKSTTKRAGEFGHMRISNEDRLCNCGRTGCWELYASKNALKRYYDDENIEIAEIFMALRRGDERAGKAVRQYLKQLFIGIENIILILNPEYVIIGGEMGKYQEEITGLLDESFDLSGSFIEYEATKILFSPLGDKSGLMGAAMMPLEAILNYRRNII